MKGMVILVGIVWSVAALMKSTNVGELSQMVQAILPAWPALATPLAFAVLVTELSIGIGLLLPKTRHAYLGPSLVLGCSFLAVNFLRLAYRIEVPCSCFGPLLKASPATIFALDLGIIICSLWATIKWRTQ